ncbi:MAG: hypothetical protein IIA60_12190 [Candidatus Marinimicrobia bacterium]|nr:hypothetical protein [Candidatus Neomarinimicrobiota bacterium]
MTELVRSPSFWPFILGVVSIIGLLLIWKFIRNLYYRFRAKKYSVDLYRERPDDEKYSMAIDIARTCKRRLRYQKKLNPKWVEPLITEVPMLIKDIAKVYYPESTDPLLAPGLSQFARAVQLIAQDIADFLEYTWFGRRLDLSGKTVRSFTSTAQKLRGNKWLREAFKVFDKLRPAWQAFKYKSPIMWGNVLAKNAGIRFLQPKIIDIVARRSIELYSGELGAGQFGPKSLAPPADLDEVEH